jgi:hypothetical protein
MPKALKNAQSTAPPASALRAGDGVVRFVRDPNDLPELTPHEAARLDAITDAEIDYSDIPELPDSFWHSKR